MPRHKHADLIIEWANGAEIQVLGSDGWEDTHPIWNVSNRYRKKPKLIKREGWVNIYQATYPEHAARLGYLFKTKEKADKESMSNRIACIHIEWEEEV